LRILKVLDVGVIYPITDSKWVAPIHVVPKKTEIMLVKNKKDELIPTRIQVLGEYVVITESLIFLHAKIISHYHSWTK